MPRVVSDPGLEEVTEDEDGVGVRVAQMRCEGLEGARVAGLQVQVGDEVDAAPPLGCLVFPEHRQLCQRTRAACRHLACAPSAHHRGAPSWNPRLPVRVFSIASMTSLPETTLPNTA